MHAKEAQRPATIAAQAAPRFSRAGSSFDEADGLGIVYTTTATSAMCIDTADWTTNETDYLRKALLLLQK